MTLPRERRRSVAFVENGDDTWACFLVTLPASNELWHGYFAFRPSHSELAEDEIRTTSIFVESSEAEIYEKARTLGRPLLRGLLDSAVHARGCENGAQQHLRGRFRTLLAENSVGISGEWTGDDLEISDGEIDRLRSLYESYRLDQVSHLICLVRPGDFEHAVDRILEEESIDFRAKDRVQFARMVVDRIEHLLPLPDFETWAADFLIRPEAYRLYAHTLHREGRLP